MKQGLIARDYDFMDKLQEEGKTEEGKYFNIKSTDSAAKHIIIK